MPSPDFRRTAPALGVHIADDAVRLARVVLDAGGRPRLSGWWSFALPSGCATAGLVRRAGQLPDHVADALRQAVDGTAVRVALASPDVACVPLGSRTGDPVAALAQRLPPGDDGDAVWADVVSIAGRPVGLAGARRSAVLRTRDALARAGVRTEAIEPMPSALAAVVLGLFEAPAWPWTAQLAHAGVIWRVSMGRGGRLEGGAMPWADATPRLILQVHEPGAATVSDVVDRIRGALGPGAGDVPNREMPALALAVGAALGSVAGLVGSPDLAAAVIVRPLGRVDSLPRWAVEGIGARAGTAAPGGRRARRGAP